MLCCYTGAGQKTETRLDALAKTTRLRGGVWVRECPPQAWRRATYGEVVAASRPGIRPNSAQAGARGEAVRETEVDVDILRLNAALQRSRASVQQQELGALETLDGEEEEPAPPLRSRCSHPL
jgi:hypothetical protein